VLFKPVNSKLHTGQWLGIKLRCSHQRNAKKATTGVNNNKPKIINKEFTNQPKPNDANNQKTANRVSQGRRFSRLNWKDLRLIF
jgi:hypothetical protein